MEKITAPGECVQQLSVVEEKNYRLAVLAKRTYFVDDTGTPALADEQLPLATSPVYSERDPNLLEQDLDLIPEKTRTDIIIKGHAYARGEKQGVMVSVSAGGHRKEIAVLGDRRCALTPTGAIVISAAEPFERMPLSFDRAYGGRDKAAEAKYGNPYATLAPFLQGSNIDADNQSPYLYPRNPSGRGYIIEATREAIAQCEMPNLEDPTDMLTPDRLVAGSTSRWIRMPIPQGLGWVSWGWFPRLAFTGLTPRAEGLAATVPEVVRRLLPREILESRDRDVLAPHVDRFKNGAPLDLQLPHVSAGETIELTGVHPRVQTWRFSVPPAPRIYTDGREGKLNSTSPVLHTVLIEPDESRVSVVWRGSAPARRPYFPQELEKMPLLVEW